MPANDRHFRVAVSPEYRAFLDALRARLGLDGDAALFDRALGDLAASCGMTPPPRTRPVGWNQHSDRAGTPGDGPG